MSRKTFQVCGDYEQMVRDLTGALPAIATFGGISTHGTISVPFLGKKVEFWRQDKNLTVEVYGSAPGYPEAKIWQLVDDGLAPHLC